METSIYPATLSLLNLVPGKWYSFHLQIDGAKSMEPEKLTPEIFADRSKAEAIDVVMTRVNPVVQLTEQNAQFLEENARRQKENAAPPKISIFDKHDLVNC